MVDADCHAHGDHIGVDQGVQGSRNACSGSVGAVVCTVFSPGIHALGGKVAANQSLGLVGSDIDTHSRGNIHGIVGEIGQILSHIAGIGQSVIYGTVACSGIVRQLQTQRAEHHGHQGAVGSSGRGHGVGSGGDAVELLHNLGVGTAGGRRTGSVCKAHNRSDFFKVAVKACTVGQCQSLSLVLVQGLCINNNRP